MKRPLLLLCALVALFVWVACTKPPAPNDDAGVAHHKYGAFGPQPSPLCLVQDGSGAFVAAQPSGVNVGAGDTITVKLASTAGVRSWSLSAYGEDELTTTSVPALTFAFGPPSTYSFTYPNATGRALLLKSVVNGGIDINGQYQPSYVTTIGLWSVIGGQRVLATGETYESNPAGWIADVNLGLRSYAIGVYGEAYALAADAVTVNLNDISAQGVPLAHYGGTVLNTSAAASSAGVKVTLAGPVVVHGLVSYTAPAQPDAGAADVVFVLLKNGATLADSLVPKKGTTASLGSVNLQSLQTAAANDVFTVGAITVGGGGTTTISVSSASVVVANAGANQGPAGPQGVAGTGGGIGPTGAPLTGATNLIPQGNTTDGIDPTSANVGIQLVNGATDGETKNFVIVNSSAHDAVFTSPSNNIISASNGGSPVGLAFPFKVNGRGVTITLTWVQAELGGLGAWVTA